MIESIAKLVQYAPTFSIRENGSTIHDYFERNKEDEGVVLVDREQPAGIIMRNNFYQKIGRQFGYSLYMKRDASLLMNSDIVCVDISCDMAKFGFLAMNRSKENLYEYVVVLENGRYAGIVSISQFLIEMSKTKEREIELLKQQQLILEQANEAEKIHRMEIEQKNASIKNLLDNAGQGFLSFGGDLIILGEHSKECDEIFGFSIANKNFLEILKGLVNSEIIHMMQSVFESVFKEEDRPRNKVYLSILPQEIMINNKYIKVEYKAIKSLDDKTIMVIMTDITEKRALEIKKEEDKNNLKLIIRAISCKTEISHVIEVLKDFFTNGASQLLNSGLDKEQILHNIYRTVHTLKGDFALNSLHHTAEQLHKIENDLSMMIENTDAVTLDDIKQLVNQISCERLLEKDIKVITEILGTRYFEKDETLNLSQKRLMQIEEEIRDKFQGDDQEFLIRLLDSLFYPNIKDIIRDYYDYTSAAAENLGKNIGDFKISGDDVYIDRKTHLQFAKSLVHVFRNIVDHGIETPDERIAAGKPEYGEIACHIEKRQQEFVINISDDGKGIDIDIIREKAVEKGIYPEIGNLSGEEILETIFLDGFSTKSAVSMISGRGVGLAAVRAAVEDIGGTTAVYSQKGKYTVFKFVLPN
ncbi:MAG: hypothetical protein HPY50_08915 [Firmicutes bacterium]|nr:hypothetical protein [Bacillota bacterium]